MVKRDFKMEVALIFKEEEIIEYIESIKEEMKRNYDVLVKPVEKHMKELGVKGDPIKFGIKSVFEGLKEVEGAEKMYLKTKDGQIKEFNVEEYL